MINEILPLRKILQVKRNKSRIDKWQGPMGQTLNCNHHGLIHRGVIGLCTVQKNLWGIISFCFEAEKESGKFTWLP